MTKLNLLKLLIIVGLFLPVARVAAMDADMTLEQFQTNLSQEHELLTEIDDTIRREGAYSLQLYKPLKALGQLQTTTGRHLEAIESYRRMQHLIHRAHGVYDEAQLESIDLMIRAYAGIGDFNGIETQQHFRFSLATRAFEDPNEALSAARLKMADWYRNTGRFNQALALYQETLPVAGNFGPEAEIRVLRSEALTMFLAGRCCATDSMYKALEVADSAYGLGIDTTQAINDLVSIATLEQKKLSESLLRVDAEPRYLGISKAQEILRLTSLSRQKTTRGELYVNFGEPDEKAAAVETVGYPIAMCGNTLNALARHKKPSEINVSLTVDENGRPRDITIDGEVPPKLKRYLTESLRKSLFTSATDHSGNAVAGSLSFTQRFDTHALTPTSSDPVSEWNHLLVAQTCQVQGVQRI